MRAPGGDAPVVYPTSVRQLHPAIRCRLLCSRLLLLVATARLLRQWRSLRPGTPHTQTCVRSVCLPHPALGRRSLLFPGLCRLLLVVLCESPFSPGLLLWLGLAVRLPRLFLAGMVETPLPRTVCLWCGW